MKNKAQHNCKLPVFVSLQTYLSDISRTYFLTQTTKKAALRIEGGKERILKVKPKGGEWGNEFHRIFCDCVYKQVCFTIVLFS